jgi:hypothetical protein
VAPSLLELQRAVRASLASGNHGKAACEVVVEGIDPASRLSIYRNTSISVLTTALRLTYPAVHRLVGDEFFEAAARAYIDEQPARSAWLDRYGRSFGPFLARFPAASSFAYLADVAQLEWAVSRALHAAETDRIDLARLAALPPTAGAQIRLLPHPALALVRAATPADAIWHAVLEADDAALSAIDPADGPVFLLVERSTAGVYIQRLSEADWGFTRALCAGAMLSKALEENPACEADRLLGEHLAAGRFTGWSIE